jgi:hypothetical protein
MTPAIYVGADDNPTVTCISIFATPVAVVSVVRMVGSDVYAEALSVCHSSSAEKREGD